MKGSIGRPVWGVANNAFRQAFGMQDRKSEHGEPYFRALGRVAKTYVVFITPRSGSTWLTKRIAAYTFLSHPDEYFNVENFPASLASNPARNIFEYYDVVANKVASPAGIFGFQISYFDLKELEKEASLGSLMTGERHFFFLTRKNLVAQAVSMYLAAESNVFHVYDDKNRPARRQIPYDEKKISDWVKHILQQEYGMENWLEARNLSATRFFYEDLVEDPNKVVEAIAATVDCVLHSHLRVEIAEPVRLADELNAAFEALFRKQEHDKCEHWEAIRGKELSDV